MTNHGGVSSKVTAKHHDQMHANFVELKREYLIWWNNKSLTPDYIVEQYPDFIQAMLPSSTSDSGLWLMQYVIIILKIQSDIEARVHVVIN